jgi:outer membrane protein TolC
MKQTYSLSFASLTRPMCATTALLIGLSLSGCSIVKFDSTAEELVEQIERSGPAVARPVPFGPNPPSLQGTLTAFSEVAASSNPMVARAERLLLASQARVRETRAEFYPQVALELEMLQTTQSIVSSSNPAFAGNESEYETENQSVVISQRIIDMPASAAIAVAQAEEAARAADLDGARQDVLANVLSALLDGSEALERWRIADAEVRYFTTLNRVEQERVDAGEMRSSLRSETTAELARARSDTGISSADYRIRADRLCRLADGVACPYPGAANLGVSLPRPAPFSEAELAAVADAPKMRAMYERVNVSLREVDQARMALRPRMSFELSVSNRDRGGSLFDGSSVTETMDASLNVEWDLFTSGRLRSIRNRELHEALATELEYESQMRNAVNDLQSAGSALEALWAHDRSIGAVISIRRGALSDLRSEQDAGTATEMDVALAQLELTQAEALRQRTRRNYVAALGARARVTGSLGSETIELVERVLSDGRNSARVYGPISRN